MKRIEKSIRLPYQRSCKYFDFIFQILILVFYYFNKFEIWEKKIYRKRLVVGFPCSYIIKAFSQVGFLVTSSILWQPGFYCRLQVQI